MLKTCIGHLLESDYPCDMLVVDNASTDGTHEWCMEFLSGGENGTLENGQSYTAGEKEGAAAKAKVFYMNTGDNIGGAGGFNFGMKQAYGLKYEYVWIMDDDSFARKDTLAELFIIDELLGGPENYGYLGSTVLFTDGKECAMNRHIINRKYYEHFDKLRFGIIPTETSTFVSLLIPMGTIKKAGLPIKEYFIWGDDVEYTMRITKKYGMPSFMVGKSIVTHAMKANIGSDISVDDMCRMPNYKRAFRNENHTYREYGAKGFFRYILRCGKYGLKVIKYAKDHRLKRMGIICSQFFMGFFFNPEIEYLDLDRWER